MCAPLKNCDEKEFNGLKCDYKMAAVEVVSICTRHTKGVCSLDGKLDVQDHESMWTV